MTQLLEDDILPALEKLRKERGDYMRWASSNDKLERLRRFCVAYEYVKAVAAKHPSMTVHFYPAGHGFNCDQRGSFNADSAKLARSRTLEFFAKHSG